MALKIFDISWMLSGIKKDDRKKALLLHPAGANAQDIFQKLAPTNATYEAAQEALNTHFASTKNVSYERSKLNQARQEASQSIGQFITRLQKIAPICKYGDNIED